MNNNTGQTRISIKLMLIKTSKQDYRNHMIHKVEHATDYNSTVGQSTNIQTTWKQQPTKFIHVQDNIQQKWIYVRVVMNHNEMLGIEIYKSIIS